MENRNITQNVALKERILFFDILRIISIFFIVLGHIAWSYMFLGYPVTVIVPFLFTGGIIFFFQTHLSMIAVYVLIFVSGAVLEYNYRSITEFSQIIKFYTKRLLRIYPAYWMSLVLGIAIAPVLLHESYSYLLFQFFGAQTITGSLLHVPINPMGWFVGLIVCLYLLFPFLSWAIKKYPYISLLIATAISFSLRVFLAQTGTTYGYSPERWFPLCSLFEFCLGIFVVKLSLYPKWINRSSRIKFLSDIAFYVFLTHFILLNILMNSPYNLIFYIVSVSLFSYLLYLGDNAFQKWLKEKLSPRGFLGER